jgi:polygalacturonase
VTLYTFGGSPADVLQDTAGNVVPDFQVLVYRAGTEELVSALYEVDGTTPIAELRSNGSGSPTPGAIRAFKTDDVTAIEYAYNGPGGTPVRWYQAARELAQEAASAAANALSKADGGTVQGATAFEAGLSVEDGLAVTGGATLDGLDVEGDLTVDGTFTPENLQLSGMRIYNPRVYGALGNGTGNDAPFIQDALNDAFAAGGGWVLVPSGTYLLGEILRIYRNTRLTLMPGAELRRNYAGTMLLNGDADQSLGGYTGHGDIIIEGGLWNMRGTTSGLTGSAMCISIGHARNVTIRDLEVRDVPGYHAIELNSTKDALVDNCRFRGYIDPGGRSFSEAVQVDLAKAASVFGGFGPYDNTACEDITVQRCYIGASGTAGTVAWPRGIGSHAATIDRWHKRVKVLGCTIEGGAQYAVGAYAWQDCLIQGNTIVGQGAGFRLWTNDTTDANATTNASGVQTSASQETRGGEVIGNTFRSLTGYDDAILIRGEATGKLTGVNVAGNTVDTTTTSTAGVRLEYAEQCTATGNTIRATNGSGISMVNAVGLAVTGNRIYQPGGSGIAAAPATGTQITGNTIREPSSHGIHLQGGSDVQVEDNYIKGASRTAGSFGIRITTSADGILLAGNKVRTLGSGADAAYGLSITNTCTNIRRYGNDLTGSGTTGPIDDQSTTPDLNPLDSAILTYTPTVTNGGSATFTTQTADYQKVGKLVWVNIGLVVNAAGSGTSTVAVSLPSTPARTIQQTLDLTCESVRVASQSTKGSAVILSTGSGATIDRLRNQVAASGDATTDNRLLNIQGAHLLAGAIVTITGWYREA